jgi:hypothetical protein
VDILQKFLDDPATSALVPSAIRPPIAWTVKSNTGFFENGFESPSMKPHGDESVWGSYGPNGGTEQGEIRLSISSALRSPWLRFYVSGFPRRKGMQLSLVDSKHHTHRIIVENNPRDQWQPVVMKVPLGESELRLKDENPTVWMAITAPREIGVLSIAQQKLNDSAEFFMFALGLGLIVFGAFLDDGRWRITLTTARQPARI